MGNGAISPTTARIEAAVKAIPKGKVSTYGRVAKRVGLQNGARQVVRVLHSRSGTSGLPWWRVLGQGKSPAKARIALTGEGFEEQRAQLLSEGVEMTAEGIIDLGAFGMD